jgi:hypothetical protein
MRMRTVLLLSCFLLVNTAREVRAQVPLDAVPLNDLMEVLVVDREVLAFDGLGVKTFRERLKLDEQVLYEGERGAIGAVFTNRRALAVSSVSSEWQRLDWRLDEDIPAEPLLGDRLLLFATSKRVLGFTVGSGAWVEEEVGPNETISDVRAGRNAGVVVTDRRALGIAPGQSRFFDVKIRVHERIEQVSADSNLATITTSQRILVFRAASGVWSIRKRNLR